MLFDLMELFRLVGILHRPSAHDGTKSRPTAAARKAARKRQRQARTRARHR